MSLIFAQNSSGPPTRQQIQRLLDENKVLIGCISDNQNRGTCYETLHYQQVLQRNLVYLAAVAEASDTCNIPGLPPLVPLSTNQNNTNSNLETQKQTMDGLPPLVPLSTNQNNTNSNLETQKQTINEKIDNVNQAQQQILNNVNHSQQTINIVNHAQQIVYEEPNRITKNIESNYIPLNEQATLIEETILLESNIVSLDSEFNTNASSIRSFVEEFQPDVSSSYYITPGPTYQYITSPAHQPGEGDKQFVLL